MTEQATPTFAVDLADVQAVIPSGLGDRPFSSYVFLRFEGAQGARSWLTSLHPAVTRGSEVRSPAGQTRQRPAAVVNVGLSFDGLGALGLSEPALRSFPEAFRDGMASPRRVHILGDSGRSAPAEWEVGGTRQGAMHAVLVLHAESEVALALLLEKERERIAEAGGVSEIPGTAQEGYRPQNGKEPFGFRDGISQPRVAGFGGGDRSGLATGEFLLGYPNHYQFVPAGPLVPRGEDPDGLLPDDPNPHHGGAYRDLGHNGSYLVYRKLQQDVAGFWRLLLQAAERLSGRPDPDRAVYLASKLVGRWPSGAPITQAREADEPLRSKENAFGYARDDATGQGCPLGAHIRRMNPRDHVPPAGPESSRSISASHRLLRRGRVYGAPLFDQAILDGPLDFARRIALASLEDDGQARGIHFLAVCANLERQFEFIQQTWANNPHFGGLVDNRDPLVGVGDPPDAHPDRMTIPGEPLRVRVGPLPRLVTMRGGGYFFLPSLAALRHLARPLAPSR
jgi:Dyp-type peroxidase family